MGQPARPPPNNLRAIRTSLGLTLEGLVWEIARATGKRISISTLSLLERGKVDSTIEIRAAIARTLGKPPVDLWEVVDPDVRTLSSSEAATR